MKFWKVVIFNTCIVTFFNLNAQEVDLTDFDRFTHEIAIKFDQNSSARSKFPQNQKPTTTYSIRPLREQQVVGFRTKSSILDGIYILTVKDKSQIKAICDSLKSLEDVVYAEPVLREELLNIPNDPAAQPSGEQYYLEQIQAYDAWNLATGSEDVLVGVIDSGTDLVHEDLIDNYYSSSDVIDGQDNDANGIIDDFQGYDFADDDNDPTADNDTHGTRVTGVIGATTNNGIGIAGIAYNSSIAHLKIFTSATNQSVNSYNAILYAADNNYKVVNLSWGSPNSFSQFNQDIITYAVIEKDMVVVAAAGNTPENIPFYPAAYDYVLSAAAVDANDVKASFGTFHNSIDLVAPGINIYSTVNGGYTDDSGSSYAAPMVAGVAALIRSQKPKLSAIEVMDIIKSTTDPIYEIPGNEPFKGKLGSGRLNAFKALNAEKIYGLNVNIASTVSPYEQLYFGDTLTLTFEIENNYSAIFFGNALLSTENQFITALDSEFEIGYLGSNESMTIGPFNFYIGYEAPPLTEFSILLEIEDEGRYHGYHAFDFQTAPNYVSLSNDSLNFSIAADGDIAFDEDGFSNGVGLKIGDAVSDFAGFFIQVNDSLLLDNLPTNISSGVREKDFIANGKIRPFQKNQYGFFSYNVFEDQLSYLTIEQVTQITSSYPQKAAVFSYTLSNASNDTLTVAPGLWVDSGFTQPDESYGIRIPDSIIYQSSSNGKVIGIKSLSPSSEYQLIDQSTLQNTLSDSIKLSVLSDVSPDTLGFEASTDISMLSVGTEKLIAPGGSETFNFVLASDDSLAGFVNQIQAANNDWNNFIENPIIIQQYTSCEGGSLALVPESGQEYYFFSDNNGLDTLARNDTLFVEEIITDTVLYAAKIRGDYSDMILGYKINLIQDIADFHLPSDTVFLGDFENNKIPITDQSYLAINWYWDFGNGTQATGLQNPQPQFQTEGVYNITLTVQTSNGCQGSISKLLTILSRPDAPAFGDFGFCPGDDVSISSSETLKIYDLKDSPIPVFVGNDFVLAAIEKDTTLFISRLVNGIESIKKETNFIQNPVDDRISYQPFIDTLNGFWLQLFPLADNLVDVSWSLNDVEISNDLSPIFQITGDSLNLTYTFTTDSACSIISTQDTVLVAKPSPSIDGLTVCLFDSVRISPEGGNSYGFYADSLLQSAIYKGSYLEIDSVTRDTTFYVANLDGIIPSEPTRVFIEAIDYNFEIIQSEDSVYLNLGRSVDFSVSAESNQVLWYINDEFETSALNPRFFFNESGKFHVLAMGSHAVGCRYSDSTIVSAFDEFIPPLSISGDNQAILYPNPGTDFLKIIGKSKMEKVSIFGVHGELHRTADFIESTVLLDTNDLPGGIYMVLINYTDGQTEALKWIKKNHH